MPRLTSGVRSTTNSSLIIDAGAVYINLGLADERLLGATSGGNQFTLETEFHTPEIDSVRGAVKGTSRIVAAKAILKTNLIEVTTDNLELALPGTDPATASAPASIVVGAPLGTAAANAHTKFTRTRRLQDTDYIANIAIVGEVSGKAENIIIILKNTLALGNLELGFEDKGEVILPVEFTAHYDPAAPTLEPWEFYYPNS